MKNLLLGIMILSASQFSHSEEVEIKRSEKHTFKIDTLVQTESVIWGFDFFGKDIVFTERTGSLKKFNTQTKKITPLPGTPKVHAEGQGGLLDIRKHPSKDNVLFFTYSKPMPNGNNTTALATAVYDGHRISKVKDLLVANEASSKNIHYGSRIVFDTKGHLYMTIGDRRNRDHVQNLQFLTGKIVRLNLDGSVPKDNPFVAIKNARPEIWSVGHRSPQGFVYDPKKDHLWEVEMGPRGGDELNLIKKGKNYGWPDVTYGREYYGPKIGVKSKSGTEQPKAHWVPSISPSGMDMYTGEKFPHWKENLFVGCLSGLQLRRIVVANGAVTHQEKMLSDWSERIRQVKSGPDGLLYLSTDSGKIVKISPVE